MSIVIRKAVKEDCARMMELIYELAVYERAPEEVTVTLDHFVNAGFGPNPVWTAFVAEQTDESGVAIVQALALYYTRYSTWKGETMYLEDLLVTEKLRGMGVGKLLFDQLFEEAKARKYAGISWQVLDWNEPAINFYKKLDNVVFDNGWVNCAIKF
ncbi:MAG: family N-acetyltransferase [Ferruginibacter sp.]|jgi:GNAT superfamily N-acetyltransferase|uniref:GNAT family N-acetyltransferase n=1 Tax=Ferruginibacter sp. TaxID=1940288 RepID=UPI00265A87E2|nr:GNAT family N-acetyltransferase [Ferruginibacter sp.]MDB5278501.1 family N-acetyltransferase [Ferruginibacter sp.]